MEEKRIDIPKGYEFAGVDDNAQQVVFTQIQPEYPKTYEECCKVLDMQSDWHLTFKLNNPAPCDLCVNKEFEYVCKLEAFRKLLICRNTYWEIAGEQMGLGRPWKPDYTDKHKNKYSIWVDHDEIITRGAFNTTQMVLTFPTKEMRDAFYGNFRKLIEECKEFL